jgi:hypothetical protein
MNFRTVRLVVVLVVLVVLAELVLAAVPHRLFFWVF